MKLYCGDNIIINNEKVKSPVGAIFPKCCLTVIAFYTITKGLLLWRI